VRTIAGWLAGFVDFWGVGSDRLSGQGFTLVDTPIFTPAACEGTTTLFGVPYFDEGTAYLTQSGQLYNEANAAAHGKVYCFGPTFRAEKSKTRRHLMEFWMVEPEVAFLEFEGLCALAEEFVVYLVGRVLERSAEELKVLERDPSNLPDFESAKRELGERVYMDKMAQARRAWLDNLRRQQHVDVRL